MGLVFERDYIAIEISLDASPLGLGCFFCFTIALPGAAIKAKLFAPINDFPFSTRGFPMKFWRSWHSFLGPLPGPLKCNFHCYSGPRSPKKPQKRWLFR